MTIPALTANDIESYYKVLMASLRQRRRPNLIGVGVARCGTTLLYELLKKQPEVYVSPIKEVNFFGVFQQEFRPNGMGWRIEDYERLFLPAKNERYLCEISPVYFSVPGAADWIHRLVADVKIIIMLREPVERLISQYKHYLQHHKRNMIETDLEAFLESGMRVVQDNAVSIRDWYSPGSCVAQSFYADNLSAYIRLFGRDNVCVLIYEDLRDQPEIWLQTLCDFLGLNILFDLNEKINASPKVVDISLSPDLVTKARAMFHDEIAKTSEIIHRDLSSLWHSN
ncbi:Sulfotransferase domain-containing protein [Allochromatium warmingii]|uniref:Sulfotransferase domain-containing protein n=1 Tax=Allochromatium warmingii TaxID=61595 RepID=A0A1H3DIA2_ALLWA|nr:sulfotransferase [Allochromatium warmingii]SDX66232.1 Sulfotransferase domain-containing protein [Allochromatium warmingii]